MHREGDRFGAGLALLALLSPLFGLSHGSNTNFVAVHDIGTVVFLVIGVVALVGLALDRTAIVFLAGSLSVVASLIQLVQFGRASNWLAGNGSTFALLLGLGIGLVVTALVRETRIELPGRSVQ